MSDYETSEKKKVQSFNTALFLGCCIMALSILISAIVIANNLPNSLHGNLHGNLTGTFIDGGGSFREFMSEWEAARFLGLWHEDLESIIESGELSGTYTIFQVERNIMVGYSREWSTADDVFGVAGAVSPVVEPPPLVWETVIVDHRVFSRERLTEWLLERMNGQ